MYGQYPELINQSPNPDGGPYNPIGLQIVLDWSTDMVLTQFSDPAQLPTNVQLIESISGNLVPLTYTSYTAATHEVILTPTNTLDSGAFYRVVITDKLSSTDGRKSLNSYNWTFQTASGAVATTTLISPPNLTVQSYIPTFVWNSVPGTGVTYTLEIDERPDFLSIDYQTTTANTNATPTYGFVPNTTYYWRVQTNTATATGGYSDIWQYWYGSLQVADQTSLQTLPDNTSFSINGNLRWNGSSNLTAWPNIVVNFTTIPGSTYANYIQVVGKSVLPRNDQRVSYQEFVVPGTWSQNGTQLIFTPSGTIGTNTRYSVRVLSDMVDINGFNLDKDYAFYFSGMYTPYYIDIREIRSRFLSSEQQLPDDLINFYIYQSSLEANARFYGYLFYPDNSWIGDRLYEGIVRDSQPLVSYGTLKWTEAATFYKLLNAILVENLRSVGRTTKVGDGEVSVSKDFTAAVEAALEEVKGELRHWEMYLSPSDMPVSMGKGELWNTNRWDYDQSIGGFVGNRGQDLSRFPTYRNTVLSFHLPRFMNVTDW